MKFVLWYMDNERYIVAGGEQGQAILSRLRFMVQSMVSMNFYLNSLQNSDTHYLKNAPQDLNDGEAQVDLIDVDKIEEEVELRLRKEFIRRNEVRNASQIQPIKGKSGTQI